MLEVYIDAASAGNPGPSAIGIYIKGEGHQVKISESVGITNNHIAQFMALIRGLQEAAKLSKGIISVRSDSKIVVSSIEKEFVKNDEYKPYLQQALTLIERFELFFIKWIPSSQNKSADQLAREAVRSQKEE